MNKRNRDQGAIKTQKKAYVLWEQIHACCIGFKQCLGPLPREYYDRKGRAWGKGNIFDKSLDTSKNKQ